ncbi:MAG TPA: ABC transporter ATP-binding protein [Actinomycetota bacterium]
MAPVILCDRLTKSYGGDRGVEDLSFEVEAGHVFGYLGPNGAGKTTTIRTLLDLIRPTSGKAEVFGLDARLGRAEIHRRIGYLPGEMALYPRLTGAEYLAFFAALRGGVDDTYVKELADRLDCDLSVRIRTLSHGNRQKVGLIQAFMHRPELLVLDEPTQGLDPLVQRTFHTLLAESRAEGRTVFLSSHDMPEVERLCDRVAILREGRLVADQDIGELKARALRKLEIRFAAPVDAAEFASVTGVREVEAHGDTLSITATGHLDPVIKTAARFEVVSLTSEEPSLEDAFLAFFEGAGRAT